MSKYLKVSDENYRKTETILKRNGITIEGEYMYAIEPYIEQEASYQLEEYKKNNSELIEGITFDEHAANVYLQGRLFSSTESFIDGEALESITKDFMDDFLKNNK